MKPRIRFRERKQNCAARLMFDAMCTNRDVKEITVDVNVNRISVWCVDKDLNIVSGNMDVFVHLPKVQRQMRNNLNEAQDIPEMDQILKIAKGALCGEEMGNTIVSQNELIYVEGKPLKLVWGSVETTIYGCILIFVPLQRFVDAKP